MISSSSSRFAVSLFLLSEFAPHRSEHCVWASSLLWGACTSFLLISLLVTFSCSLLACQQDQQWRQSQRRDDIHCRRWYFYFSEIESFSSTSPNGAKGTSGATVFSPGPDRWSDLNILQAFLHTQPLPWFPEEGSRRKRNPPGNRGQTGCQAAC